MPSEWVSLEAHQVHGHPNKVQKPPFRRSGGRAPRKYWTQVRHRLRGDAARAERVMKAMLEMRKLDIAALQTAAQRS